MIAEIRITLHGDEHRKENKRVQFFDGGFTFNGTKCVLTELPEISTCSDEMVIKGMVEFTDCAGA